METTTEALNYGKILAARECSTDGVTVNYVLFESSDDAGGQHIYSVQLDTRSEYGRELASACDISRNRDSAVKLFHVLADAMVTSCTLYEVLEDLL